MGSLIFSFRLRAGLWRFGWLRKVPILHTAAKLRIASRAEREVAETSGAERWFCVVARSVGFNSAPHGPGNCYRLRADPGSSEGRAKLLFWSHTRRGVFVVRAMRWRRDIRREAGVGRAKCRFRSGATHPRKCFLIMRGHRSVCMAQRSCGFGRAFLFARGNGDASPAAHRRLCLDARVSGFDGAIESARNCYF